MHGARRVRGGRGPGHRPGQRVVDLERRRVAAEPPHPGDGPPGQVVVADQTSVELLRTDTGQYGAAYLDLLILTLNSDRAPAGDHDLGGRSTADQLAAPRLESAAQRLGERTGPADRCGIAHGLPQHAEQQSDEARAGCVQWDVCVAGVSGQQQPCRVAAELVERVQRPGSACCGRRTTRRPGATETLPSARPAAAASARSARPRRGGRSVPPPAPGHPRVAVAGCASSIQPAVSARSRCNSAQVPSRRGWPSTAGACAQASPYASSPSPRSTGEA